MRAVAAARGALARAAARRPGAPPVAGRQGAQAGGASAYAPVTQAGRLLLARGADEPGRPPEETRSGLRGWPPAAPASRGPGSRAPGPGRTSSATGTCPEPEPRVIWAEHLLREQLVGAWYTLQMSSGLEAVRGSYRSAPFASRLGWIPASHPLPRARGSTDPRPGAARPGRPVQASLPACDAGRRPSATWPRHRIVSSDLVAGSSSSYIQHCAVVCGHQLALALADDRTFKVMHRSAAFRHLWRGLTRGRATGHPRPQLYRGRSPSVLLSIAADCL
ncbi:unnamed protein product [Prorocentrum cordatum]|uniref:Uncharacterized protein n=1 Tax=Prorocentrum cordatum TaxID=2364126 RepID=A0ABN9XG90_9DINO|nr:unnamed protein product [Polarella glacialis]